jgi:hypothetical protein
MEGNMDEVLDDLPPDVRAEAARIAAKAGLRADDPAWVLARLIAESQLEVLSRTDSLPARIDEAGQRFGQALAGVATPVVEALGKVEVVVQRQLSDIDKKLDQAASKKVDSVTGIWADAAHLEVQKRLKNEGRRSVLIWGIAGAAVAVAMMVVGGLVWNVAIKTGSVYECQTFHGELWCRVRN